MALGVSSLKIHSEQKSITRSSQIVLESFFLKKPSRLGVPNARWWHSLAWLGTAGLPNVL